jgi:multiple sugar transport system substrate-binding protein
MTTNLRLWGREFDGFRRAFEAHAAAWPGGTVSVTLHGLPELQAAALGPTAPDADILVVPADWLPAMAAAGRILPLDTDCVPGWPDAWASSFRDGVTWDADVSTDVWGLPFHDGPQLLFTRPTLLAEHGLRTPATWSEFLDAAAALHRPRRQAGTVLAGAPDGHNNVYDFVLHLWRHGGDLVVDGRATVDTAEVRVALEFLRRVATTLVGDDARHLDSTGSGAAFADRRVGTAVNWAGYAALAAEGMVAGDFVCSLVPAHDDGTPTTTVNAFWAATVTAGCAAPDLAWSYLRHAASAEMDLATTSAGASGTRFSTWTDPRVLAAHPEYALFEAAHAHSRPLPRVPGLPALVDIVSELVDAVVWRGEDAEPAIARAQCEIEQRGGSR